MVFKKICETIADVFSLDESEITMETKFVEDLKADSVDFVEIAYTIEEEFGITKIPDENLKKIVTVGDLVEEIGAMID